MKKMLIAVLASAGLLAGCASDDFLNESNTFGTGGGAGGKSQTSRGSGASEILDNRTGTPRDITPGGVAPSSGAAMGAGDAGKGIGMERETGIGAYRD